MRFDFVNPQYLYILFVVPFMVFFYFFGIRSSKLKALKFANFEAIARIKGIDIYSKNIYLFLFDVFIVVVLVLSLAGMSVYVNGKGSEYSYVVAIDASESMGANDLTPTRLDVARYAASAFVDALPRKSRVGLLSFSGNTFIESELTTNKPLLKDRITNINLTSVGGTDVYEAISIASLLLKDEKGKSLVLISDGQINQGDMEYSLRKAVNEHIIINTLAIGTIEGGEADFGMSKLDEATLINIANYTNGKYANVNSLNELNRFFTSLISVKEQAIKLELGFYLLIASIVLFILRELLYTLNSITL